MHMKILIRIIASLVIILFISAPIAVGADPEIPPVVLRPVEQPGDGGGRLKTPGAIIYAHYDGGSIVFDITEDIAGSCELEIVGNGYTHYYVSASELRAGVYVGADVSEIVLTLPNGRVYTANI